MSLAAGPAWGAAWGRGDRVPPAWRITCQQWFPIWTPGAQNWVGSPCRQGPRECPPGFATRSEPPGWGWWLRGLRHPPLSPLPSRAALPRGAALTPACRRPRCGVCLRCALCTEPALGQHGAQAPLGTTTLPRDARPALWVGQDMLRPWGWPPLLERQQGARGRGDRGCGPSAQSTLSTAPHPALPTSPAPPRAVSHQLRAPSSAPRSHRGGLAGAGEPGGTRLWRLRLQGRQGRGARSDPPLPPHGQQRLLPWLRGDGAPLLPSCTGPALAQTPVSPASHRDGAQVHACHLAGTSRRRHVTRRSALGPSPGPRPPARPATGRSPSGPVEDGCPCSEGPGGP